MKKGFLVCLLFVSALFARTGQLNQMLRTIEKVDFTKIMKFNLEDMRFNPANSNPLPSASKLYKRLASKHETVIIRNLDIGDSLLFNRSNCKVKRLVFVNCRFPKKVTFENSDISTHLAFIGCRFEDEIGLKRISCQNVSFLANAFKKQFQLTENYGEDHISQIVFVSNDIPRLNIESFNAHGQVQYTGKVYFDNMSFIANKIDYTRVSGAYCKNLLVFFGNIAKNVELNDIKLDYLLTIKFNVMDSCRIFNCIDKKDGLISIANNSIQHIDLHNNTLRYTSLNLNYLKSARFANMKTFLSFQLRNNFLKKYGRINLKSSDFASLSFEGAADSIFVATGDTSAQTLKNYRVPFLGTTPQFPTRDKNDGQRFVRLKLKWIPLKKSDKYFAFNLHNMSIDEKNWHIHFDQISKIDDQYRINPQDSVLSSRHEVYTAIYNAYRRQGKWEQADDCYYEWKQFERQNYWALSGESFFYKLPKVIFHNLNWISCGYGIKPLRIFPFAVLIVFVFALFYFVTPQPISNLEHHLISAEKIKKALNKISAEELAEKFSEYDFDFKQHKQDLIDDIVSSVDREEVSRILGLETRSRYNLNYLWNCFYFSFSTFTTVGLGDWYPSGNLNRAIVMLEGALGWLSLGLFITTYANVLLR